MSATARRLDSVENFSIDIPVTSPQPALPKYEKGMYRRQYRAAARNGIWGRRGCRCGGSVIEHYLDDGVAIRPVLCDTWACDLCGPRKAAWLIRELKAAQERYRLDYFWTLTVRTSECSAAESYTRIKRWWNILRGNLVHKYGPFNYVWICESTKAGYAHLHLIISLDIQPAELSAMWFSATGGSWVVDVEPVASERASNYITKYCSQQARQRAQPGFEHLKGKQLFNHSRSVKFGPFRPESEKDEVTNEGTGEVKMVSRWIRSDMPYFDRLEVHKRAGLRAKEEQVHGVPHAFLVAKEQKP